MHGDNSSDSLPQVPTSHAPAEVAVSPPSTHKRKSGGDDESKQPDAGGVESAIEAAALTHPPRPSDTIAQQHKKARHEVQPAAAAASSASVSASAEDEVRYKQADAAAVAAASATAPHNGGGATSAGSAAAVPQSDQLSPHPMAPVASDAAATAPFARPAVPILSAISVAVSNRSSDQHDESDARSALTSPAAAAAAVSSGSVRVTDMRIRGAVIPSSVSTAAARLVATSTLDLVLAACIPDSSKRTSCLSAFVEGDITLDDMERNFALYFPRVGVPQLMQWGLIIAGPCIKLQAIIRERIELKAAAADDDCVEIKKEAGAAGK